MRKDQNLKLGFGNKTDIGRLRENNQDYFGRYAGDFGNLLIVCDGMGGYKGGELAAQTAVEAIYEHIRSLKGTYDPCRELLNSLTHAQVKIDQVKATDPDLADMGTTAVIVLIQGKAMWYSWVGDSRIYFKRGTSAQQISKDHSYVQELVDHGLISPDQAREHPQRNKIVQALGTKLHTGESKGPLELYRGDTVLLCSDGLHEYFDVGELSQYLIEDPQAACDKLVDAANSRGGKDNITVQVCRVLDGPAPPKQQTQPDGKAKLQSSVFFAIVLLSLLSSLTVMALYLVQEHDLWRSKTQLTPFAMDSLSIVAEDSVQARDSLRIGYQDLGGEVSDAISD